MAIFIGGDCRGSGGRASSEIREAIAFHLDGMREDGLPIPVPTSKVESIELTA
ncbi:MAG: hypothetical protein KJ023_18490 [Burkholderiaceae bacterium]|nr:hypothetical protein [Burkholderiaceae bacterium]